MQEWIEWVRLHPVETMVVVFGVARLALKYIPAETTNPVLQVIREIAKIISMAAPPDQPAMEKAAEKVVDNKLADRMTGAGEDNLVGRRARSRMLRRHFRKIAHEGDLDISLLDDDDIDEAIERAESQHAAQVGGPVMDFLSWAMANKEAILAIFQIILSFTGERPVRK